MIREETAKEQHYIPQFILRNWSDDEKTIHIWYGKDEKKIKASISNQFKKKHLYGNNEKIEKELFANDIEPNMSKFIQEIRKKRTIINDTRPQRFILSSLLRTKFFIELNTYNIDKMVSYICKNVDDAEKTKREVLKNSDLLEDNNKIKGYEDMSYQYGILWHIVKTLRKTALLRTNKELVIGENPVVFICPFMNRIIDPLFMILYPISPKELLVLYRPEDGVVDTNRIIIDEETHILNSYQFQQTDDIIAFHDKLQINFDKFENQYGMLNKCLREVPIENSEDCVLIPHTIQDFHFDYDYGLKKIINPKKQTLDDMIEYAVKTNDHSLKRNLIEYGICEKVLFPNAKMLSLRLKGRR